MGTRELLDVEDALQEILALSFPLPTESAPIQVAIGRALSDAVLASRTLPPWDNSAMDGFAVRADDLKAAPARLSVVETIYAGQIPAKSIGPGQCARIMTGAPLPAGADAVVMQEKTRAVGDAVEILERVPVGAIDRTPDWAWVNPLPGRARYGSRRLVGVRRPPALPAAQPVVGRSLGRVGEGVVGKVDQLGVIERVGVVVPVRVPVLQLAPPSGVKLGDRGVGREPKNKVVIRLVGTIGG